MNPQPQPSSLPPVLPTESKPDDVFILAEPEDVEDTPDPVEAILPAVEFRIRFASSRGPLNMEAVHDSGLSVCTSGFLESEMRRRCLLRLLDMIERGEK